MTGLPVLAVAPVATTTATTAPANTDQGGQGEDFGKSTPVGFVVLVLFFGGLQLLAVSILGEYVGKILEETKQRPKFIRRSIRSNGRKLTTAEDVEGFVKARSRHGAS